MEKARRIMRNTVARIRARAVLEALNGKREEKIS
jgi:hypothetical protein